MGNVEGAASQPRRNVEDFLYPGPRPLGRNDIQLLVGRELDVARLVYQIYNCPVVEITAPSGTGKSSILAAGVIPSLGEYGFTVVTLRSWAEVRGDSPREYYYHALKQAFADTSGEGIALLDPQGWPEDPDEGMAWVAEQFQDSLVVIFDQLEELMRVDEHRAQTFLQQVVSAARESTIRQVLSLRSEFKAQLNVVESQLGIKQWHWYRLDDVAPEHVRDVILAPRRAPETGDGAAGETSVEWPIEEGVVDTIRAAWDGARERDPAIGLLHLQAALWVLEEEMGTRPTEWSWSLAEGSSLFNDLVEAADASQQRAAVASALLRYIELALSYLEGSLRIERNRWAGVETRYAIARFVDDLSSAGYKIPVSVDDLFLTCYEGLQDLRADRQSLRKLRRLWEAAGVIQSEDAAPLAEVARSRIDEWRREEGDPLVLRDRFFSGRLWKKELLEGLCEMEVVFERALRWLESRGIVRITPDSNGVRLVTLIHDGFGNALNSWAERAAREPDYYLRALVGENGTSVLGGTEQKPLQVNDRKGRTKAYALQWSGCSIDNTDFTNVVFEDCDLRGTVFSECRFTNVEFRSCYMPGVLFIEPTIAGEKGLVISDSITRTLSVTGGGSVDDAGLTFDSIMEADPKDLAGDETKSPGVDGLFISGFDGPWTIKGSSFRHLSVTDSGKGSIRRSNLALIRVDRLPEPVSVQASDLRMVDSGVMPDGRVRFL